MTETESALDVLTTLRAEVEARQKQMRDAAKEAVKVGTKAIFEEYGDILAKFGWTQYTPYFNDGDPCTFGLHELVLVERLPEDASEDEREAAEAEWPYESSGAFSTYSDNSKVTGYSPNPNAEERYDACKAACLQVYEALSFGEIAKDVFGDHVTVTFTADGVDVEEYEHE